MMRKILYVHNSLGLGGAQSVRYMFLKNLPRGEFSIDILCLGEKGEFGRKIESLGYRVNAFNRSYGLFDFITTIKLARQIKKHKYDIVHSALFYANYHCALAAKLSGIKVLIIEEHGEHNLHRKIRHAPLRYLARFIGNSAKSIVCCSEFVKKGVEAIYGINPDKLIVIKNPVEDKKLQLTRTRASMRGELGVPEDAYAVGTVSSLYWVKNQRALVELVARLNASNTYIIIVGDGPLKGELTDYAKKLEVNKRVIFTGWRSDVADLLNSFDIFALPSLSEGLPVCLLEAMSMGLPCIASRAGGITEVIEDGVNGLLLKENSCHELIAAVRGLFADVEMRKRLGEEARKKVTQEFTPKGYISSVLKLYGKCLLISRQA